MPKIKIEGTGRVLASRRDRTITGLLIPYNELGRTNAGRMRIKAGKIKIPRDPSVVSLNIEHDRMQPVGRAVKLWETAQGIMATFKIGKTAAGDKALNDVFAKRRACLSGEFTTGIDAKGYATGGVLAAAGIVKRGAFPSAMVLASEAEIDEELDELENIVEDLDGAEDDGDIEDVIDNLEDVVDELEDEIELTDEEPSGGTLARRAPARVARRAAATHRPAASSPAGRTSHRTPSAQQVFAAIATFRNPTSRKDPAAGRVLAALSDVTTTGLLDGGNVARPLWMEQIYQGIPYEREYVTLGNLGTEISLGGKEGYTLHRGTQVAPVNSLGGTWAGNKTEIPSGTGFTKSHTSFLERYAFGADIAREFYDLDGGAAAVAAFFALVAEDNLMWADDKALATWRMVAGLPTANLTYPAVSGHDYETALGQVIQGILAVKKKKADGRRDNPTFIIANEKAYEELMYTPKDLIPEFVNFTASTDWSGSGDGIRLVVGDTGITSTSSVIVGDGMAVDFDELPGGPLKIDALDIAKGGIDQAIHGYLQTFIKRYESVVHIGTPDARANATAYQVGDLAKVSAVVYQATTAGTSHSSPPEAPAVGATVTDGTVVWKRLV
jgi:hypothetical protein